ncbi:MAG: hypothetical protein JXA28_02265, partial [Bacteroidetes bacterium]|nr:hypothetical protein [Bacteroidota bacterium]
MTADKHPTIKEQTPDLRLFELFHRDSPANLLIERLPTPGRCLQLHGVHGSLKGILLAELFRRTGRQLVVIS